MKKLLILSLLLVAVNINNLQAQDQLEIKPSKASMGLGAGMDFGGIGGKLTFFPSKTIALFVGLGAICSNLISMAECKSD